MDNEIMIIVSVVISSLTGIITIINHRRIRSSCCGTKLETSLDIESTTPPNIERQETLKIKTPKRPSIDLPDLPASPPTPPPRINRITYDA
jgi:hypothetical protein